MCFSYDAGCIYVEGIDFSNGIPQNIKDKYNNSLWREFLTEKWLLRALRNLKKYCCFDAKKLVWDKYCKKADYDDIKNNYPKSTYLFDHILSVMVRRLDSYNYEWVDMDKKAKEWLDFFNEYATKPEWAVPTEFINKYKKYRSDDNCRDTNWELNTKTPRYKISMYDGVSSREFKGVILNTEWWTSIPDATKYKKMDEWDLTTKYLNVCQTAIILTMSIGGYEYKDQEYYDVQNKCVKIIDDLLEKYTLYYWSVITTQWNLLAQNSLTNYNNYLKSRYNTLNMYLWRANTYRFWVLRMIQQITPKCN